MDFRRLGERVCLLALGWLIGTTFRSWEISASLFAVYALIAVAILGARSFVVSRRDKHDRERAASRGAS